jgi:predicted ATPase/class 3 adenylate cyclase
MRPELPSGTVTFLFTDIEGSTRLLRSLGVEGYARALAEHRAALRAAFTAHSGVEVDTQGDAFFVAFPTAPGAAAAALAAQAALRDGPIRVRMGLHTGSPAVAEEGYVGIDVHRGARVAALAHGGQVLVSSATAALLDERELVDLGAHRLKDFDGPMRLCQLGAGAHPPLRTPGTVLLPSPATAFVGREQELFDAVSIVLERDPRVLTIVGPGGTGKTRFALELARLLAEDADGGTLFVPLAPLRDVKLMLPALAEALGAADPEPSSVAAAVGAKRTHLVLDNVEQLLPDAAGAIAAVVAAAPALRLLVTSREALRISAEMEVDLPPLVEDEAVELFLARASSVRTGLVRTATVTAICERLDRLPLALELAAARTKLFSPEALLDRLGTRLDLLRGSRDADPRHETLNATIGWSYELLDPEEQRVFAGLAVFRGGCTAEAAEAVCDADVDALASLLDKSLLRRRSDTGGGDRLWMLETIREFAAERLAESGHEATLRHRQAERLLELARSANLGGSAVRGQSGRWRLELIEPELDNVRAVLDWAAEHEPECGLALAAALEEFWVVREPVEGASRLGELLEAAADAPPSLRAEALRARAGAFDIFGQPERAEPAYRESLALFSALGDELNTANLRFRLAANMVSRGEVERAMPIVEEALREFRRLRHRFGETQALSFLAIGASLRGDDAAARDLFERSAAAAREVDWPWWEINQLGNLAELECKRGRFEEAMGHARRSLELAVELGDRMSAVFAAAELAGAAAAHGDATLAGRLWGAIEREEGLGPIGQWPPQRDDYRARLAPLAGAELERAVEEGRLLTLREAGSVPAGAPAAS